MRTNRKRKGNGKTAQMVLNRLLGALESNYPGIGIANDDFWFQTGDYVKMPYDLARWGALIPYKTNTGTLKISLHSWDTMKQCAKGLTLTARQAHTFEVVANE